MPHTFPPVSPSGNSTRDCVQYQDQEIDSGAVLGPCSRFTSFVCVAMWFLCNHHRNQDTELFHHRRAPWLPLYSHTRLLSPFP